MWVVKFEEVSKRHRQIGGSSSLRSDVGRMARRMAGQKVPPPAAKGRPALDELSFEIEQGTAVALVGRNGAGKSTALRLMSRINYPSAGRVRVRGRVGALLEVGSGVHPELSGRENIWLYGSIIGITRAQIRKRFDEIVAFSELEASIDKQTKFYSSGMQLRLGFAIATYLEPQTLLVDESLATADLNFQLKCIDRLAQLVRDGTTLVFVSHEAAAVETLCTRALLLDQGRLVYDATTQATLAEYQRLLEAERRPGETAEGDGCRVVHVACVDEAGNPATRVSTGGHLVLEITVEQRTPTPNTTVEFVITDGRSGDLIVCNSGDGGVSVPAEAGRWVLRCRLDGLPLRPRSYRVWVTTRDATSSPRDNTWTEAAAFRVHSDTIDHAESSDALHGGPVAVDQAWSIRTG